MAEQVSSLRTGIKYKNTPIGKIPVDWELVQLGDICEEIYRYPTYYNIKYVEQDGVPEVRGELIKNNGELSSDPSEYRYISKETSANFPRTILHEGDFVLSVRGTMGKIGYIPDRLENANMTANLMRISPDRIKVYPLWLKQFFLSDFFQKPLEEASSATTIKTIKAPELKAIELPLPLLSEQKKVAEILTTVDEAIEKTDQIIEKTKEAKKGLMQRLFTRGIGHKKFKKTEIEEIPIEWEVVKLKDVAASQKYSFVDGPFGSNLKSIHYTKQGIPVIQSQSIISGVFKPAEEFYVSEQKARELERSKVSPGDIVIAKIGVNYGASGTIPKNYPPAVLSGNTMKITPDPDKVTTEFLQYLLHYFRAIKVFDKIVSTTAQPAITLEGTRKIMIPLPPLPEQKQIAGILSSVDQEIEEETGHREQLEFLKKGLMQVLLIGKIRVSV